MNREILFITLFSILCLYVIALTNGCVSYHKDPGFNYMMEHFEGGVD